MRYLLLLLLLPLWSGCSYTMEYKVIEKEIIEPNSVVVEKGLLLQKDKSAKNGTIKARVHRARKKLTVLLSADLLKD